MIYFNLEDESKGYKRLENADLLRRGDDNDNG